MQHDSGENTEYSYFGRTTRKYILGRRKPQSIDQFMIFNTHIMQVANYQKQKNRFLCKTTEYSVLFDTFLHQPSRAG